MNVLSIRKAYELINQSPVTSRLWPSGCPAALWVSPLGQGLGVGSPKPLIYFGLINRTLPSLQRNQGFRWIADDVENGMTNACVELSHLHRPPISLFLLVYANAQSQIHACDDSSLGFTESSLHHAYPPVLFFFNVRWSWKAPYPHVRVLALIFVQKADCLT